MKWRDEGKKVQLEKDGKRRTGGWGKAIPDIEWFVKRASETARAAGKKLFLHGFSMVSHILPVSISIHRTSIKVRVK